MLFLDPPRKGGNRFSLASSFARQDGRTRLLPGPLLFGLAVEGPSQALSQTEATTRARFAYPNRHPLTNQSNRFLFLARLWHLRRLEANDDFVEDWIPDHSCSGHNPDDVTPFHDLFLGDDGSPLVGEDDNMREVGLSVSPVRLLWCLALPVVFVPCCSLSGWSVEGEGQLCLCPGSFARVRK